MGTQVGTNGLPQGTRVSPEPSLGYPCHLLMFLSEADIKLVSPNLYPVTWLVFQMIPSNCDNRTPSVCLPLSICLSLSRHYLSLSLPDC